MASSEDADRVAEAAEADGLDPVRIEEPGPGERHFHIGSIRGDRRRGGERSAVRIRRKDDIEGAVVVRDDRRRRTSAWVRSAGEIERVDRRIVQGDISDGKIIRSRVGNHNLYRRGVTHVHLAEIDIRRRYRNVRGRPGDTVSGEVNHEGRICRGIRCNRDRRRESAHRLGVECDADRAAAACRDRYRHVPARCCSEVRIQNEIRLVGEDPVRDGQSRSSCVGDGEHLAGGASDRDASVVFRGRVHADLRCSCLAVGIGAVGKSVAVVVEADGKRGKSFLGPVTGVEIRWPRIERRRDVFTNARRTCGVTMTSRTY